MVRCDDRRPVPRLFVALPLPDDACAALRPLCFGVQGARWVAGDAFHLTLAFLGEVDEPTARRVEQGLITIRPPAFTLRLRGLGHFPPRGPPKVLWAGVAPSEELMRLQRAVRLRLERLGLPVLKRRFAPHVTLARLRGTRLEEVIEHRMEYGALEGPEVPVRAFVLFSSVLGREGAVHRPLAAYPLG